MRIFSQHHPESGVGVALDVGPTESDHVDATLKITRQHGAPRILKYSNASIEEIVKLISGLRAGGGWEETEETAQ